MEAFPGKIVLTSTDKAVNPTNVMGASKLMGEQLIRAANLESQEQSFFSTRFGNVLGYYSSICVAQDIRSGKRAS